MLIDGLKLMVVGMGTVVLFLTLMVVTISIAAKILAPFAGVLEESLSSGGSKKKKTSAGGASNNVSLISAVVAAVHQYRKDNE